MSGSKRGHFSSWLYKVGAAVLFVLSIVALFSFIMALKAGCEPRENNSTVDSLQIEGLRIEVQEIHRKVDSLVDISRQEPKVVYKYLKPQKENAVIEVNVHNDK